MRPVNIKLHIKELVLHGFAHHAHYEIRDAVEQELSRLIAERGILPSLADGDNIREFDAGTFEVANGSNTETIGNKVAHSVYRSIKPIR